MRLFQYYFLNFWVWWYAVKCKEWILRGVGFAIFILNYTNTLPMAQNITRPLFQDNSDVGKLISFVIRVVWVWWGGMLSLLLIAPVFIGLGLLVVLPLLICWQIIVYFLNLS